jgi:hypothetical protein
VLRHGIIGCAVMVLLLALPSHAQEECTEYREVTDAEIMPGADLGCVNLNDANLRTANLRGTNLQGADLSGANLQGAHLTDAIFDEDTILPDAEYDSGIYPSYWTPDTDMARFTDPDHPDFWDPCVEARYTPRYCADGGE